MSEQEFESLLERASTKAEWLALADRVKREHQQDILHHFPRGLATKKSGALTKKQARQLAALGFKHLDYPNWWFDFGGRYARFMDRIGGW